MHAETGDVSFIQPITLSSEAAFERRVQDARRVFRRTLASWASDLLLLRSRGLRAMHWSGHALREAA